MESRRCKIMLVDDNMANLTVGKNMLKDYYEVYAIPSAVKLFEIMNHVAPDLILMDVMMPEIDGYQAIRRLKADERFSEIPVIFLTSKIDQDSELEGLSLGAIDYVAKPFAASLLLKRIENHLLSEARKRELKNYNDNLQEMVRKKTGQIVELQNAVLSTVAEMVEFRDTLTGGHVTRTQNYLQLLVDRLLEEKIYAQEVSAWNLDFLVPSAQLHDVGKIAISDAILNKPGRLTPEEFEEMKKHVTVGVEAIRRIEKKTSEHAFLRHARIIAGTHHEKWDGSGYPDGLRGEEIPLEGRLMAVADVYDALISTRPYKKPISAAEAEEIIRADREKHFDPLLVDIFQTLAGSFAEIAEMYR
ncbi:MAG: response regulator [Deltaproteobacteria bacterium]|jgi:putative two-component system response regulator|nr:response regulator [Deltaproteobacteria bacterium]